MGARYLVAALAYVACASGFVVLPAAPLLRTSQRAPAVSSPLSEPAVGAAVQQQTARTSDLKMGLFGLGTPELAVIAGIALLVLGPDQVKKLAKDVGKVSAELKQVPEEFNKGMDIGAEELAKKKESTTVAEVAPAAPATPETPAPPAPPAPPAA